MPDLASEIFGNAVDAYNNLNAPAADAASTDATTDDAETNQDVESADSQGTDAQQPETPDKSAEQNTDDADKGDKPADAKEQKQPKVDGAAKAREWGEQWKRTAEEHENKLKEVEPIIKAVEEKFGGTANLDIAAEIYQSITDEDNFDPEAAVEYLSETVPGVAEKLVGHIARQVIDKARATAIKATFGRELNADEVAKITDFLAAGQKAEPGRFEKLFKGEDIPDDLKYDAEGNELPPHVIDYMRRQAAENAKFRDELNGLKTTITTDKEQAATAAAGQAIESYVSEQFAGINAKISELGLDKAVEGETPELKSLREEYAGYVEGIALYLAGKDEKFQALYQSALGEVAKAATGKNKVAKAKSVDYSRRIQERINTFAAKAADVISPLIENLSKTRQAQVEKATTKAKTEIETGGAPNNSKPVDQGDDYDPFDKNSIHNQFADLKRTGKVR